MESLFYMFEAYWLYLRLRSPARRLTWPLLLPLLFSTQSSVQRVVNTPTTRFTVLTSVFRIAGHRNPRIPMWSRWVPPTASSSVMMTTRMEMTSSLTPQRVVWTVAIWRASSSPIMTWLAKRPFEAFVQTARLYPHRGSEWPQAASMDSNQLDIEQTDRDEGARGEKGTNWRSRLGFPSPLYLYLDNASLISLRRSQYDHLFEFLVGWNGHRHR